MGTYDKYPCIHVKNHPGAATEGYEQILSVLREDIARRAGEKYILMIDCYPEICYDEMEQSLIEPLGAATVVFTDDELFLSAEAVTARVKDRLTDDRVFGQMCLENYSDFVDGEKRRSLEEKLRAARGLVIIYGVGARLVCRPDLYIYADLARWEIQCRFRSGKVSPWKCAEPTDDNLRKFKWDYFFSWRAADRHKKRYFSEAAYFLDTNRAGSPRMITGDALRAGLDQAAAQPFRLVPFFDPGVWGGQWMKKVCGLDPGEDNYAWCFDCVPEENSLLLECGGVIVEIPSIDLVFFRPKELLGPKVYARFGAEFPIRFDFLDTMGGGNLSLQVHPLVGYIQEKFGMHYTQEESYYILDAAKDGDPAVYLGVKTGTQKEALMDALHRAQECGERFDEKEFINRIPVRKHDHILIPPGTIHCSGKNTMVLEISATPYIFTFKLWDWGRLGLDNRPRPVHLEHGEEVIQFDRDTEFVYRELVDRVETLLDEPGHVREATGLHELEFIQTEREWFEEEILCRTQGSVNVLNLVEGDEIEVRSPEGAFEPFTVHYAETFIVPAQVGPYLLCPGVQLPEYTKSAEARRKYGVVIARVRLG